jgi:hypothetical protein
MTHWKEGGHKRKCKRLQKEHQEKQAAAQTKVKSEK